MRETEVKILLSEQQYKELLKYFDWKVVYSQINFYYSDIENNINEQGITIRIRSKKSKLLLQIKKLLSEDKSIHENVEYETEIESIPYKLEKDVLEKLCEGTHDFPDVFLQGYLVTERCINTEWPGTEICLDRNIYLDKMDYELELEFVDTLPKDIIQIIEEFSIETQKECKGKYTRFFERLLDKEDANYIFDSMLEKNKTENSIEDRN